MHLLPNQPPKKSKFHQKLKKRKIYEYIEINGNNKIIALVLNIVLGKNSKI